MPKFAMPAIVVAVFATASCSPLWPAVDPLQTSNLPWLDSASAVESVSYTSITKKDTPAKQLAQAQNYAQATLVEFSQQKTILQHYKNGEVLALFGLGTTAGVNVVVSGGKEQLRTLGLFAAGILGLDQTVGLTSQYTLYAAGVTATDCLINVDAAQDAVANGAMAFRYLDADGNSNIAKMSPAVMSAYMSNNTKQNIERLAGVFSDRLSADHTFSEQLNDYNGITVSALARNAAEALQAHLAAANSAADPSARASMLAEGIFKIRTAVQDQLFKSADTTKIYSAMQTAMSAAVAKPSGGSSATLMANLAALRAAPAVQSHDGDPPDLVAALNSVPTLMSMMQAAADQTSPVQNAVDQCVQAATGSPPPPKG
jgi:hypothetical protein